MSETTDLRWFESFPRCGCGKFSQGILRGSLNQSYGHHCARCAERRLKASEKVRAAQDTGRPVPRHGSGP